MGIAPASDVLNVKLIYGAIATNAAVSDAHRDK